MAEHIEKQKAVDLLIELENEFQQFKPFKGFEHAMYRKLCEAEIAIGKLPTADVVPVVRCKDCKYRDGTPGQPNILCAQMHEEDFCSYGERRAEKEPPEEGET